MPRGIKAGSDMVRAGVKLCRYEYDHWVDERDGRLYLKVTGMEWERATEETFFLAGKRRMRNVLEDLGQPRNFADGIGRTEIWDRAFNIADQLLEAVVLRTLWPLPVEDEAAA